jgi:Reverse transcriptase (RNA-dependent DNA polymerase)
MAKAFDTLDHDFITEVYKFFGMGPNIIKWLNLCGNQRTACIILDNNVFSRQFTLGCGRPQGDNTSPTTFNFCEQILIFKLELAPDICRIPAPAPGPARDPAPAPAPAPALLWNQVPNNNHFVSESNRETNSNESLADDNTLLSLINKVSLSNVKMYLNDFYLISGLKCNYDKTMIMPTYEIDNEESAMLQELGFTVVSEIKLLGATISRDLNALSNNFTSIRDKIVNLISFWERFRLSLPGRISIAKTFLVSQINYLGCILEMSDNMSEELQRLLNNFIRKNLRISEERMYLDPSKGGIGFFNLKAFLSAQKCAWIFRAKKNTIDNWRFDLACAAPDNDILLIRSCDFRDSSPILFSLIKNYEQFYGIFSGVNRNYERAYIFSNSTFISVLGGNTIDVNFFGRDFYNRYKLNIRKLTFDSCFIDNVFKSQEHFRNEGLPLTPAAWMRLRNTLLGTKRRLMSTVGETDPLTIQCFFTRYKKGSMKFRSIMNKARNNATNLYNNRCFVTFKDLVSVDPGAAPEQVRWLEQWIGTWSCSFLTNDLRMFIFNCRFNSLPLNNRLNSYNPEIDPRCTFCRILNSESTQRDSFIHCFLLCPVTKKLLIKFLDNYGLNFLNADPESFRICYWFGNFSPTVMTAGKNFLLTLIFDVFRYIVYRHRLRRHIPNQDSFLDEYRFTMKTIFSIRNKLAIEADSWQPLARFTRAIG